MLSNAKQAKLRLMFLKINAAISAIILLVEIALLVIPYNGSVLKTLLVFTVLCWFLDKLSIRHEKEIERLLK